MRAAVLETGKANTMQSRDTPFRGALWELLGGPGLACSLQFHVNDSVDVRGPGGVPVTRQRVSYAVEQGEVVHAFLLLPTAAAAAAAVGDPATAAVRRLPAVLAHHQHNDEFHLGKSEVVGVPGAGNPQQAYGLELAARGYVVLAPDALCFEERGPYAATGAGTLPDDGQRAGWDAERHESNVRIVRGECLQTKYSRDAIRGVDVLAAHPLVDAARIGAIGHSLGGQQTLYLAALDTRVAAAAASCGFSSMAAILRERINHNAAAYVPGLARHGDLDCVLSCVAPRPFLALNGGADPIFPTDGVEATMAGARPAYEAAGAGKQLDLRLYAGQGHAFTAAMRAEAYAWLDTMLYHVPTAAAVAAVSAAATGSE
jgi:dienelactone hydrolase